MLVKELRQGLRTRGFVGAFVLFQIVMAIMMLGTIGSASLANAAERARTISTINGAFWGVIAIQLLLVTPARALGSLQAEMESRTLDLLLLTRLNAWRIVVGKWTSLLAQAALLLVAMLPYGIVRYFGGSADLVEDALFCLGLLGGCAVITAAGLWASGLPKLVRFALPVALFFVFQAATSGFRGSFGLGSNLFASYRVAFWFLDGALVAVFFLVTAVRRIAPAAETHVVLARGLPLLALIPVPLCAAWGSIYVARAQFVFAGVFLAVVCMIELSNVGHAMIAHWRPWAARGMLGRFVGRLVMAGWQSALLYAMLVAAIMTLLALVANIAPPGETGTLIWTMVLALTALVFPVIVLSLAEKTAARSAGRLYLLTFAAMSTVAAVAGGMASMFPLKYTGLASFARVLPVSGLWLSLGNWGYVDAVIAGQAGFAVIVLGVALMQSRAYWREFALFEFRERIAKP